MKSKPLLSVITPVYNTPPELLTATIESVRSQAYSRWELILVDDHSPNANVRKVLAQTALEDERIRVVERDENGGISKASNDALAIARGEYVALLDHDDALEHGAFAAIAEVLDKYDDIDYLYTDEDKIDEWGDPYDAFLKPDWSPERLRNQMYCGHLSVVRTTLARAVGGFNSDFDGSQDHDFILRVTERSRRIYHLRKVLYHWRAHRDSTAASSDAKPYTWDAGVRAVDAHLQREGIAGQAVRGPWANVISVNRVVGPDDLVSIVIPTRGSAGSVWGKERVFVVEAVRSVLEHTAHPAVEFVVVHDTITPKGVLDDLRAVAGDKLKLVEYADDFNFSEKCNLGVVASSGKIVVLLNDDIQVIKDRFVEELIAPLSDDSVGMTGAYLLYEDGSVQHAGHQYAQRGYRHPFTDYSGDSPGPFCALLVDREVSGLTAACVALRRAVFDEVGGLSEMLANNFNDVDLSFKIRSAGYRLLWLHRAKLYHFESKTRQNAVQQAEVDLIRARWGIPYVDPYLPETIYPILRVPRSNLQAR